MFKNIWKYNNYIKGSVYRDFSRKHQNAMLGFAWSLINPLIMIFLYTIVFSEFMKMKLDSNASYPIYLCIGIITWSFFSETINKGLNIFIENSSILKKNNIPKIVLPIICITNTAINFSITFSLFLIYLIIVDCWPGMVIVSTLPILIIQIILAMGIAVIIGLLNVFFRDVAQIMLVVLQLWFWLTPIVYPIEILPDNLAQKIHLNPITPLMIAYHNIYVSKTCPEWNTLIYPFILGVLLCVIGLKLYREKAGDMVDEL